MNVVKEKRTSIFDGWIGLKDFDDSMYEWQRESTTGVFTVGLADMYDVLVPLDRPTIAV